MIQIHKSVAAPLGGEGGGSGAYKNLTFIRQAKQTHYGAWPLTKTMALWPLMEKLDLTIPKKCTVLLRFSKTHEFWSSKANWHLCFLLLSIILVNILRNRSLLIIDGSKKHICGGSFWTSEFMCFSKAQLIPAAASNCLSGVICMALTCCKCG